MTFNATAIAQQSDPLPTLDQLLGLDDMTEVSPEQTIIDTIEAELDEVLDPQKAGEKFTQAVDLMDQVATRIQTHSDLSLTTQRLQEDILGMLDQVIESASQNESSSSSSSSQSSSSNDDQPDQSQQSEQAPKEGQVKGDGESANAPMPAGSTDAQPGKETAPDGVRWGSLPERIRDALSQGMSDQYSDLYRSLTEQYYKSLAEDKD